MTVAELVPTLPPAGSKSLIWAFETDTQDAAMMNESIERFMMISVDLISRLLFMIIVAPVKAIKLYLSLPFFPKKLEVLPEQFLNDPSISPSLKKMVFFSRQDIWGWFSPVEITNMTSILRNTKRGGTG